MSIESNSNIIFGNSNHTASCCLQALTVADIAARQPNTTRAHNATGFSAIKQSAVASAQQAIQARAVADATDAAAAVALQNAAAAALAKKQSHRKLQGLE